MTRTEQRVADLERQLADLRAEVKAVREQAGVIRAFEEVRAMYLEGDGTPAAPRRPRHLRAVSGGAR
jgi:hypothetical protein